MIYKKNYIFTFFIIMLMSQKIDKMLWAQDSKKNPSSNITTKAQNDTTNNKNLGQPTIIINNNNKNKNKNKSASKANQKKSQWGANPFILAERYGGIGVSFSGFFGGIIGEMQRIKKDDYGLNMGMLMRIDYRFYKYASAGVEVSPFLTCRASSTLKYSSSQEACSARNVMVPIMPSISFDPLIFYFKFGLGPHIHIPLEAPQNNIPIAKGLEGTETSVLFGLDTAAGFNFAFSDTLSMPLYANFRFVFTDPILIYVEGVFGFTYRFNMSAPVVN